MSDLVKVKFRLDDGRGLRPETFTWPLYREFTDRLLKAMQAMRNGPPTTSVAVAKVDEGSACPVYHVPRENLRGVYRLRDGPTRSWTDKERRGAEPLYEFTRNKGLEMECGIRTLHPVVVPTPEEPWTMTERTTLLGTLRRLGGTRKFTAEVKFDRFTENLDCFMTQAVAEKMAPMLFKRVELSGILSRDMTTRAALSFQVTGARLLQPVSLRAWRDKALRVLGEPLVREDNDAFIRDYG